MKRSSGILLPIFSLPSKYGIGSFGKEAENFARYLYNSGQTYWQILPLTQVDAYHSPYTSSSTYAGNELFIDLEQLVEENLISETDLFEIEPSTTYEINYEYAKEIKYPLFKKAYKNYFSLPCQETFYEFIEKNKNWIVDFSIFQTIHEVLNLPMKNWPMNYLTRDLATIQSFQQKYIKEIQYHQFLQFLFYHQFFNFKEMLKKYSILLIGDLPMYVNYDSADVWSSPSLFYLDKNYQPMEIAGVPPDYFSSDGQMWGNPLYNIQKMKKDGYQWWLKRIQHCSHLFDCLRIDHFRAFSYFYSIQATDTNAKNGKWKKGFGLTLLKKFKEIAPELEIIAEDLGIITNDVIRLRKKTGFPGMALFQFAFDKDNKNPYLPHNYDSDVVAYIGTHDNATLYQWWNSLNNIEKDFIYDYLAMETDIEVHRKIMKCISRSSAKLTIYTMQDLTFSKEDKRINTPGTCKGNWEYMLKPFQLKKEDEHYLNNLSRLFNRLTS